MRLLILQPGKHALPPEKTPAILWLHGGGYATGMPEMAFFTRVMPLVKKYGAVAVSPAYRLSGIHPYPAALEDGYQALLWLKEHARALGACPDLLMVGGESAGGGLTAALCMYARDRGGPAIAAQMPLYPMLDDRDTDSSRNNHAPVWNTRRNHAAWKMYLRNVAGEIPAWAAPGRQTDYTRLPPAYTFVGDREPFYCETLTYVQSLKQAGIGAEADVYPGKFHAFDMFQPFSPVTRTAVTRFETWYCARVKQLTEQYPCGEIGEGEAYEKV